MILLSLCGASPLALALELLAPILCDFNDLDDKVSVHAPHAYLQIFPADSHADKAIVVKRQNLRKGTRTSNSQSRCMI